MIRYDRKVRLIAVTLAALAGFVDAVGFLASGGFFVSFMSGNSTRLGVGLADHVSAALSAGSVIAAFLFGVVLAALVKKRLSPRRQQPGVMAITAAALTIASLMVRVTPPFASCLVIAMAMGAINLLFEEGGDVRIGLTYMTGTLVKVGHHIANALSGGPRWTWASFLALWLGLAGGAVLGAVTFGHLGLDATWVAGVAAWALFAVLAIRRG
jgi:uncharacterized membrane protein YoaK (UPF0700 family)